MEPLSGTLHAQGQQPYDTTMPKLGGAMQDCTDVSLRVGHYLHVQGVVTKRVVDIGEIGGVCTQWLAACHLSSHGIGKRYWKGRTLQRRLKRAKQRGWLSRLSPKSGYVVFSTSHIAHIGSPRSDWPSFERRRTTRETCHGH